MNQILEIVIAFFLVVGAAFAFIGSLGLFKFDDFYMRLHGPTKATTLGLGGMLTASAIYFTFSTPVISLHEVLISMFLFITAPVSAHILAKTALHKHFHYLGGQEDPLTHPMNLRVANITLPVDDSDEIVAVSDDVEARIDRSEVEPSVVEAPGALSEDDSYLTTYDASENAEPSDDTPAEEPADQTPEDAEPELPTQKSESEETPPE